MSELDRRIAEKIELAWAAGFFDGEGNAGWHHAYYFNGVQYERGALKVGQVNKEPLERFQKAVRGGNINGPYEHKGRNNQPYYEWRVQQYSEVKRIGELLLPFVCSIKRDQLNSMLEKMSLWQEKVHNKIKVRDSHGRYIS